MPVYKNEESGTWYSVFRYTNWKGERKQKCKRGFKTKKEAQEWELTFKQQSEANLDMSFKASHRHAVQGKKRNRTSRKITKPNQEKQI